MAESTQQTTTQNPKKNHPWLVTIGILLAILIGARLVSSQGKKNDDSQTAKAAAETEEDDGSLPKKLRGSVGETKTFDCYYIEPLYVYDQNKTFQVFVKGQYSGADYWCKAYISRERHDTDCVYLHIAADEFEEVFGQNAASGAGASGTIIIVDDGFARRYDEPIHITGKIMDIEELGRFSDDFKEKTGKTKLMDYISVSR